MKITHLREIVRNVQAHLTCPKCQAHYSEDTLDVVDLVGNRGVFAARCTRCNTSTLVTLNVRDFKQKIATREKQIAKVQLAKVSPNDVIEMKNFIQDFNGDFSGLLASPKTVEQRTTLKEKKDATNN